MNEEKTETSEQEAKPAQKAIAPIDFDNGVMRAQTLEAEYRIAQVMVQSGMVPKGYDNPAKVIAGRQFAAELGLPPMTALRQIAVVNGTPTIFGDLPLALCLRSGELQWIDEKLFDQEYREISVANKNLAAVPYAAVCKIKRRNGTVIERFFTIDDAKAAGLLSKSGPWTQYRRRMLQLRARSMALKDGCPDLLMGAAIAEYDFNTLPNGNGNEVRDVAGEESTQAKALQEAMKAIEGGGNVSNPS